MRASLPGAAGGVAKGRAGPGRATAALTLTLGAVGLLRGAWPWYAPRPAPSRPTSTAASPTHTAFPHARALTPPKPRRARRGVLGAPRPQGHGLAGRRSPLSPSRHLTAVPRCHMAQGAPGGAGRLRSHSTINCAATTRLGVPCDLHGPNVLPPFATPARPWHRPTSRRLSLVRHNSLLVAAQRPALSCGTGSLAPPRLATDGRGGGSEPVGTAGAPPGAP